MKKYVFVGLHWFSPLRLATVPSSESESVTSFAHDRMRSSSSSLWVLQLRGGEPGATVVDDVSDEVDSWLVHNNIVKSLTARSYLIDAHSNATSTTDWPCAIYASSSALFAFSST